MSDDDRDIALAERQRLAAQRRARVSAMGDLAEQLLDGIEPEKLSRRERIKLAPVAIRLMEMYLRAERLELGLATDHISNVRPPKPVEEMSLDELRAWRAKLELLSQV